MDARIRTAIMAELSSGRFAVARQMIDAHLAAHPDDLMGLALRGTAQLELGETEVARETLTRVSSHAMAAGDSEAAAFAQLWLGYLHNRLNDRARAADHFERSAMLAPPPADLCGALCQTLYWLGHLERSREWGAKALAMRAAEGICQPNERVAQARPRAFSPTSLNRNILSFSLFGDDPYYQECAVTIARSSRGMFPEFRCRFYCSPEVPESVLMAIRAAKAQMVIVTPERSKPQHPYAALMWRFLAFDDPEVDVVLIRDVDNPFALRERAAIDLWVATDKPFISIRDHHFHTEPLMAGMWGGFTGLLPPLGPIASRFRPPDRSRFVDQTFLRLFVWPRIRDATLSVDSVYSLGETVDFPATFPISPHIPTGSGWPRREILGPP